MTVINSGMGSGGRAVHVVQTTSLLNGETLDLSVERGVGAADRFDIEDGSAQAGGHGSWAWVTSVEDGAGLYEVSKMMSVVGSDVVVIAIESIVGNTRRRSGHEAGGAQVRCRANHLLVVELEHVVERHAAGRDGAERVKHIALDALSIRGSVRAIVGKARWHGIRE